MNLIINSKLISYFWWVLIPAIVAKIIVLAILLFLYTPNNNISIVKNLKQDKIFIIPKVFDFNLNENNQNIEHPKPKVTNLTHIALLACYSDNNKNFIIIKDNRKTIFLDLKSSYKGAKLVKISLASAIFSQNGIKTTLYIAKKSTKELNNKINNSTYSEGKYVSVSRGEFKKYTNDIRLALRDIRIKEVIDNGNFTGVRLSFLRKGSLFDKMGLRKNDIIESVDGHALQSIVDLLPYYKRLNTTSTLSVGIRRNKEIKEIVYEIN